MKTPILQRTRNAGLGSPVLRSLTAWMSITVLLILMSPAAHAGLTYIVTDLGFFPGDDSSEGIALNDLGEAVGISYNSQTLSPHAFLYRNGKLIDLSALGIPRSINLQGQIVDNAGNLYYGGRVQTFSVPGSAEPAAGQPAPTDPLSINNRGQIVGTWTTLFQHYEAFLREPSGQIIKLGAFGGVDVQNVVVNFWGQIAGTFIDADGNQHAFLTQPGGAVPKDLGSLGGNTAVAAAVNDLGQVVGSSTVTADYHSDRAFLYTGGKMINLGTLGGVSQASGINDFGQIVGASQAGAWVYFQGQMLNLNSLLRAEDKGWSIDPNGINNRGQIIADATLNGGATLHAVILTPVYSALIP